MIEIQRNVYYSIVIAVLTTLHVLSLHFAKHWESRNHYQELQHHTTIQLWRHFFKSLKAEELYRNNYRSEREFRERVQKYIDFYNDKRPHQINRYRTPNATEEAYFKRHADDISQKI